MARGHGRISSGIWEDQDFLDLDPQEQRLYLFLISQSNLNHAGLLPLTLRRWARKARGLTSAELEKQLQTLADARFIVTDEDTEELLIRSFVRNDGVWKQPKVMGAMVSGAMEIESKRLRGALLAEMNRIPLEELSDEPTKYRGADGPSIRQQVRDHIQTLRKSFGNPDGGPSGGGYGTPSASPSDTPDEGGREGSTRGRGRAPRAHSPAPAPTPTPAPDKRGAGASDREQAAAVAEDQRPDGLPAPIDDDGFELTDAMRRWAIDTFGNALDVDYETAQFVSHQRAEGRRRRNWPEEWRKWMRRSAKYASERAGRPPLRAVSGGHKPWTNPTNQDDYDEEL